LHEPLYLRGANELGSCVTHMSTFLCRSPYREWAPTDRMLHSDLECRQAFSTRLRVAGKREKVARYAAARKLLPIAWAVVTKDQWFDPSYALSLFCYSRKK
jgi:hypothetical protein